MEAGVTSRCPYSVEAGGQEMGLDTEHDLFA